MIKRISNTVTKDINAAQFDDALSAYAAAVKQENKVLTILDEEMKRIRGKYSDELSYLENRKKNTMEVVQTYCREQKQVLFGKRRSIGSVHGIVGFRLGTPKLKTLRGVTWEAVLERLKEKLPAYVRTTEEPAKDLLLADRSKENVAPLLPEIGVHVVQEELFYIELKKSA